MRIAFYAPLKGPDHPVPSGDRQMARLLVAALVAGGHSISMASRLRSFLPECDPVRQCEIERDAEAEARAIESAWSADETLRPDLWFTYHPFYKAPDFLGPRLTKAFAIPYVTAEASNAPKRAIGPWASWHQVIETGLKAASVHFCFTDRDREGLEALLGVDAHLIALPPFIDASAFMGAAPRRPGRKTIELIAVAMMRAGDKMRSFAFLADALSRLPETLSWHLSVVGDGMARTGVEAAFRPLDKGRVSFLGLLDAAAVGAALRCADVYVWPGFNEAFGVSYLEAGAAGLPVLALCCGGIGSVVRHGETGLLVAEGDIDAYTGSLADLIVDEALRLRMSEAAKAFVVNERTVARAAAILDCGLTEALGRGPQPDFS